MNTSLAFRPINHEFSPPPAPQAPPSEEAPCSQAQEPGFAERGMHFVEKVCGGGHHALAGFLTGGCVGGLEGAKLITEKFMKNVDEVKSPLLLTAMTAIGAGEAGALVGSLVPPLGSFVGFCAGVLGTAAAYALDQNENKFTAQLGKVVGKIHALVLGPVVGGLVGGGIGAAHGVIDGWKYGYDHNGRLIDQLHGGALGG
ncbi:MAG: hypothetical protein HYU64_04490 [Armatimonadetes bacterium]|nr:hypothetical protein [Armatimonadota bacterium]